MATFKLTDNQLHAARRLYRTGKLQDINGNTINALVNKGVIEQKPKTDNWTFYSESFQFTADGQAWADVMFGSSDPDPDGDSDPLPVADAPVVAENAHTEPVAMEFEDHAHFEEYMGIERKEGIALPNTWAKLLEIAAEDDIYPAPDVITVDLQPEFYREDNIWQREQAEVAPQPVTMQDAIDKLNELDAKLAAPKKKPTFEHEWSFMANSKEGKGDLAYCELCKQWRFGTGKPFKMSHEQYQEWHNTGRIDAKEMLGEPIPPVAPQPVSGVQWRTMDDSEPLPVAADVPVVAENATADSNETECRVCGVQMYSADICMVCEADERYYAENIEPDPQPVSGVQWHKREDLIKAPFANRPYSLYWYGEDTYLFRYRLNAPKSAKLPRKSNVKARQVCLPNMQRRNAPKPVKVAKQEPTRDTVLQIVSRVMTPLTSQKRRVA